MSLRDATRAWNDFFFKPELPLPISLFRILYGLVVIADLLLLRPDWLDWYGPHGWVTLASMSQIEPGVRINVFKVIPQTDAWVNGFFWVFLVFALMLTAGLFSRVSSVVVFVCLTSMHQRNLFINHGGDTFLRVAAFFLMFAPAGAAFSLDRLLRRRLGREDPELRPRRPWAQRMIQIELALLYLCAFWWKSLGETWVNGTALYYVRHLSEIHRFPVPGWLEQPILMKAGTWLTLVLEFSLGVLIWFKELRYPLLAIGALFHLCLEYSLNVPIFQWDVLSAYVLFVDPEDLARLGRWIRRRAAARLANGLTTDCASPLPIPQTIEQQPR